MAVATHKSKARPEKFGTIIGRAPGGVPSYSSDYDSSDPSEYPSRRSYMGHTDGIYTGYRYQCVEFARRWLIETQGITFGDVGMAYEVMRIGNFQTVEEITGESPEVVPLKRTENGGKGHLPVLGSIILWQPQGFFKHTGHIGVITHLTWECDLSPAKVQAAAGGGSGSGVKKTDGEKQAGEILAGRVGIAEQNVTDAHWPEGSHCARELRLQYNTATQEVAILEDYRYSTVLGWVTPKHNVEAGGAIIKQRQQVGSSKV